MYENYELMINVHGLKLIYDFTERTPCSVKERRKVVDIVWKRILTTYQNTHQQKRRKNETFEV